MAFGLRWIGRILAIVALTMMGAFLLGTGGFNPFQLNTKETALMAPFLMVALGLVVGLNWEVIGGALTVAAMLCFYWVHYLVSGSFPQGWAFAFIALPGVCFLAASFFEACKRRHHQSRGGLQR